MKENNKRVLAYRKAKELSRNELIEISGGSVKFSCESTQKVTGSYPGTVDGELDQIWD